MLSWTAGLTAIVGAFLLSLNSDISKFAWLLYLTSSLLWTYIGIRTYQAALVVMNTFFTFINVLGISRWLF